MPEAVSVQELVTIDIRAHESAWGSFGEEAPSLLRKQKTCSPNLSGQLLHKHSGPSPHSLGTRNHHSNLCNPRTPPTSVCRARGGREPALQHQHLFWSCGTVSSGLGEHLALCPPACRTALPAVKERGAGVSQGGRVGRGSTTPSMQGPVWARSCS